MSWLAQMEARRLTLSLRELLVRHDENEKADTLMRSCVPFLCDGDPEIERARADQADMVAHLKHPSLYAAYYAANVHERPFEEQYGIEPAQAHEHLPRVAILREWVAQQTGLVRLLDLACNDGWMAQNLAEFGISYDGIDLNPDCIERAKGREVPCAGFTAGDALNADALAIEHGHLVEQRGLVAPSHDWDAVVAFEVIEHVADPDALLEAMLACVKWKGSLFISTPCGATEQGDLPRWFHVEPKGHVRVYTPQSLADLIARHCKLVRMVLGPDNVLVAELAPSIPSIALRNGRGAESVRAH